MSSSLDQYPQRDGLYRIMSDGVAVHNRYEDRVIKLDPLGSEIWLRADGKTPLRDIAGDMAGLSGQHVQKVIRTVLTMVVVLNSEGLMFLQDDPSELPYHLALPQEDQDLDQMRESMEAAGWLDD